MRLIASIALCGLAAALGSLVTITGPGSWYIQIAKPFFTPPGWVFGPVWTTLYILMAIALYLVWMEGFDRKDVRIAISLFLVQLVLNVLWSYLFFGMQSPLLGFIEIVILWIAILVTIIAFWRIRRLAAILLIPYLCWVTIATALTWSIFVLN
ncbi:MAG: tryptophan-rich sensory protein [Methanoregulaceae archaeon]|nr:tryptophan-rich sensory protein [Methanoregulaceae archaeon]